ncbi:protein FAM214A-like [Megalops cyprinoides]|uniref:protein FAM214A-like n=1 Tax=Megalops cyprinoides TaxID=118141 RepID=UPI001863C70D|nr:protein FAM214A-like [Megalops cyprinoides]
MKPDRDAAEEFFEYDAEEFLVLLSLLITEGRTPECSVKGRTEGLHCPPAQSALPVHSKHECSDKLPQCRQARRTRSEVVLLWRNNIPIMVEVMLLPDCCYSDEGPTTEGNDINDPAIKQDALLLERWTLQPVPRQSGDRFIEEKTLLLAVRSYVFFSQLSAWLSASHGIVPRNILYRISAADEELLWNFSQPPAEHAFPIPNVSHSVALKVRVQSLPRQPNYPVLKCSIHTSLSFHGKRSHEQERPRRDCDVAEADPRRPRGSPPPSRTGRSPVPNGVASPRQYPHPDALPPSKAVKWLYSRLSGPSDVRPVEGYGSSMNGAEGSKAHAPEAPARAPKSLLDPLASPRPGPRPPLGETNPLIGSLLQERQEVIARIAQHLNYCDPTAPHIPDSLFGGPEAPGPKAFWGPREEDGLFRRSKEPCSSSPSQSPRRDGSSPERTREGRSWFSPSDTPPGFCGKAKTDSEPRASPKPASCRKLLLLDPAETQRISEAVQDISRLIQDTFQQSQSKCTGLLHCASKSRKEGTLNTPNKSESGQSQGQTTPLQGTSPDTLRANGTDLHICTDLSSKHISINGSTPQDCPQRPQDPACRKLEGPAATPEPKTSHGLQNAKQDGGSPLSAERNVPRPGDRHGQNEVNVADASPPKDVIDSKGQERPDPQRPRWQDENRDPSARRTLAGLAQRGGSQERAVHADTTQNGDVLRANAKSPLKPCNIWKKQNRHSLDGTATKAFHPCTGLPLLSSPVPQRKTQTGYFDLDTSLIRCNGLPWAAGRRVCLKREGDADGPTQQLLSTSAPPASLSLLGNFEECVLNYRLEPLGNVEGFSAEVGASGTFCPSHMTLPVDVSFYSVSDDNAPSPYMGVINLESLGKRGYRVPPSGTIQVTLFNPNKTVVKMFVVVYDLREMPANHQTFLRQRTFSVPVKRETNGHVSKKPLPLRQERTLRYLIHLRFQSSKSGKIYLHRDIRLLFSRKSMEVDSGAAYELKSFTESPADPPFSPRC